MFVYLPCILLLKDGLMVMEKAKVLQQQNKIMLECTISDINTLNNI